MSFTTNKFLGTVAMLGLLAASSQAHAQATQDDVAALKAQLRALEKKLDSVQKQANTTAKQTASVQQNFANANAAMHTKAVPFLAGARLTMPGNRPTFCTDDGANCIAITGRLHLDTAAYSFSPKSGSTPIQSANDGVNARRARLGLIGTFSRDWEWGVIVDAGGTTDGTVGLNNAYVAYKGVKGLLIQGGYIDVPYTLEEATSSNNIMFLERSSAQTLATSLGAGDNRAAFGGQVFDKNYWVGAYVTGPATGANTTHTAQTPLAATFRAVGLPINNEIATVLVGFDALYLASPTGGVNSTVGFNDRIEVRVDPATNALLNASALNVDNARVLSGEAAVKYGSFLASGEYFDFNVSRTNGLGSYSFNGAYGQASYVLTGEQHKYGVSSGAFGGVSPARPVNFSTGDLGAWELAVRYSYASLNDGTLLRGGELKNTTVGVNWYVNDNMRFMFDWIHGTVDKYAVGSNVNTGADYDVFAMRTQVAW